MVIHIITSLGVGGAEMMLSKIVFARKNLDINDVVVCLTKQDKVGDLLTDKGVKVHYLNMKSILSIFKVLFKLNALLNSYKPSVIQTWLYHADLIGGIVAKLKGIKVIWNIRQTKFTSITSFATILVMRLCAGLSYFIPNKIICVANASLISHAKFGYSRKKLIVIPNGFVLANEVDLLMLNQFRKNNQINNTDLVIGTVGRFHHDKDYHTFVKAAGKVIEQYPNVKFLMVGKNLDVSNSVLTNWINEEKSQDNFILIGETSDVNFYLSLIDIFCLSSISEGFPNVVGEAMLKGVPCVVTDSGDSRLIVGETGYIVAVQKPVDLGSSLIKMINIGDFERKKLGLNAQHRIKNNFMIDDVVKEYSVIYRRFSK